MEPTDLNSPRPGDADLEAWLREHAAQPALPDDGFTPKVLSALPMVVRSAARRHAAQRRLWFCLVGALAGLATGLLSSQDGPTAAATPDASALPSLLVAATGQLTTPAMALAAVVTAVSLLVVYWQELQPRRRLTG